MLRANRTWCCLKVAVGLALCLAVTPASADEVSRLKNARDVVTVTHAADNFHALLPTLFQQLRPLLMRQGADEKAVDALLRSMQTKMDNNTDELVDFIAKVYAREFSDDDLDALLTFYHTPAGQHLIDKQKVIMQGMMAMGQQYGQMIAKQVLEEYAKERGAATPKL